MAKYISLKRWYLSVNPHGLQLKRPTLTYINKSDALGWPPSKTPSNDMRMCLVGPLFTSAKIRRSLCTSPRSRTILRLVLFSLDSATSSYKCSNNERCNSPGASCHTWKHTNCQSETDKTVKPSAWQIYSSKFFSLWNFGANLNKN